MSLLRKCNDCGLEAHIEADLETFAKEKSCLYGYRNLCSPCARNRARAYELADPDRTHKYKMKYQQRKRYGITAKVYQQRMATSDKCECCGSKENLCYDHCHESMAFRGVLCRACNAAIGALGDTEEGVIKALTYLVNHRERGV